MPPSLSQPTAAALRRSLRAAGRLARSIASVVAASASMQVAFAQDECSTATAIVAGEPAPFSTGAATASANPPGDALCPGTALEWGDSPDAWFRWIAPRSSFAAISTCSASSYDTSIAVYRGACEAPTLIACNGDAASEAGCQPGFSRIDGLFVEQGVQYYIRIGGRNGQAGLGTLRIDLETPPDGALDARYPVVLAVQDTQTGFGDATDGTVDHANGSELDSAYATVKGDALHVFLAGNLESNFQKVELFVDAVPGGQQRLRGDNADIDFNGLNRMGDDPATAETEGLRFDAGFAADLYITATCGGSPFAWHLSSATLPTGGSGAGSYLGSGGAGAAGGRILGPAAPFVAGFGLGLDNSNAQGVLGGCAAGSGLGVATGLEFRIPLGAIAGYAGGPIRVCAFINAGGHDDASNQFLGGLGGGCNLAEPRSIDLAAIPGNQYFVYDPACEVDADGDGIPDCTDNCDAVANPDQRDCDASGIGDACEIASGALADCDADGIPNICEGAIAVRLDSGPIAPFGSGFPASKVFTGLPPAAGPLPRLRIEATSDLGSSNEFIAVTIDGGTPFYIFAADGSDCPSTPDVFTRTFSLAEFAALASDGSMQVDLLASGTVSATQCADGGVRITLSYEGLPGAADCNGNGSLDSCEIGTGTASDCNANGRPDSCDLAAGAADCNMNGTVDSCEIASGAAADCNMNGVPDACDLAAGFGRDCNGNGTIDACEVLAGTAGDCDRDGLLDSCALAAGAADCDGDGIPDTCGGGAIAVGSGEFEFSVAASAAPITHAVPSATARFELHADGTLAVLGRGYDPRLLPPASLGPVAHFSAGAWSAVAVEADGDVVAWGQFTLYPFAIPAEAHGAVEVSVGKAVYSNAQNFALARTPAGRVVAWGLNDEGQCSVPADLASVVSISAGGKHSLALTASGVARSWGRSNNAIPAGLGPVSALGAGSFHSLAVRADGTVAAWGLNNAGQTNIPADLGPCTAVAGAFAHSIALRTDGTVRCWGANSLGECTPPPGLGQVVKIAAETYTSMAVKADGTVAYWGLVHAEQTRMPAAGDRIVSVSAASGVSADLNNPDNRTHWAALLADGTVRCWGVNRGGQCDVPAGLDDVVQVMAAASMQSPGGHTVALRRNGQVVCWGNNSVGQCDVPPGLKPVVEIAAPHSATGFESAAHTMALQIDGKVVCWGSNSSGKSTVPTDLPTARTIAAGPSYSLAVTLGGTVVKWGALASPPAGLAQVVQVDGGVNFALALRADGTVAAWGSIAAPPAGLAGVKRVAAGGPGLAYALKNDGSVVRWQTQTGTEPPLPAAHGLFRAIGAAGRHVALVSAREEDCDLNGTLDSCEIAAGTAADCNGNGRIDSCELRAAPSLDCNANGLVDSCEIAAGTASDCDLDGVIDSCRIAQGALLDCNANGVLDSCELASGAAADCDANGVIDACDLALHPELDCDLTGGIDRCEILAGTAADCDGNGRVDSCDMSTAQLSLWGATAGSLGAIPAELGDIADLAIRSTEHAVALRDDGRIFAWGDNTYGETNIPAGLGPVRAVGVGTRHTLVVLQDGSVRCWGDATGGLTAVPSGLGPVKHAAVSSSFNALLLENGSVVTWASNGSSQFAVPAGLPPCTDLESGVLHIMARLTDSTVRVWGSNGSGQMNVPSSARNIVKMAAGDYHCAILRTDGSVACWGSNSSGQSTVPTGLRPCIDIAASTSNTLALRADGIVERWGSATTFPATPRTVGTIARIFASGSLFAGVRPWTPDCDGDGVLDACEDLSAEEDCDANGVRDLCQYSDDCDGDGLPDACEIAAGAADCNGNGVPDPCDLASGTSSDLNGNGVPDDCGEPVVGGSGYATIDAAIAGIPDGSTVVVGAGTYPPFTIDGRSLVFTAATGHTVVVDGAGSRCGTITGEAADLVQFQRFRFINGSSGEGGAILASGASIVLEDCSFASNSATGGGGALRCIDSASVLLRCVFTDNSANAGGAVAASGLGDLLVVACEFSGNNRAFATAAAVLAACPTAIEASRFELNGNAADGTILTATAATTIDDCGFCRNAATEIAGPVAIDADTWFSADCNADGICDRDQTRAFMSYSATWPVSGGGNGRTFIWYPVPATWENAHAMATALGGHLATLTSAAEDSWVTVAFGQPRAWIGGFQADGTGEPLGNWQWVTGEPWSFTNWYSGEPNDLLGEDRLELASGAWNDNGCPSKCGEMRRPLFEFTGAAFRRMMDCDGNGALDGCDIDSGAMADCNGNGVPDQCEIDAGTQDDCDGDGVLDGCETGQEAEDCNGNGIPDGCDLADGTSTDLDASGRPDECESIVGGSGFATIQAAIAALPDGSTVRVAPGAWAPFQLDGRSLAIRSLAGAATTIIDGGGIATCVRVTGAGSGPSEIVGFTIRDGFAVDGGGLRIIGAAIAVRECRIVGNTASARGGGAFCDAGTVLFAGCVFEDNTAPAGAGVSVAAGQASVVSISGSRFCLNSGPNATGPFTDLGGNIFSQDCDADGACDADEIATGAEADCDANGVPDDCEIAAGGNDCNGNGTVDACDIANGTSADVDGNGTPDECKPDCDGDALPDAYEIAQGLADDCDGDLVPDDCEIAAAPALDCDDDGVLDACELADDPSLDCNANGRIDSCDIADGAEDENANGKLDSCELARGDLDLDGTVGAADLSVLLSFWGFPSPPVGDLDGDGVVGAADLSILLSNWG